MATKAQKRAEMAAKHEAFLEAEKQRNAEALRVAQSVRENEEKNLWQSNHDKNHSWKKRIVECPLCRDLMSPEAIRTARAAKPVTTQQKAPTKTQLKKARKGSKVDA